MLKKFFFVIVSILLAAFVSHAQVPQLFNYQGFLRNAAGAPVTGSLSVEFRIYKTPTGGTALWTETQTVTVNEGVFNVLLGATVPIPYSVFEGGKRYLALRIGSDPEMAPRKRFASVAYAFHTSNSDSLGGFDSSAFVKMDQPNSISTAMLQDDGVTTDKILPDIVSSVSGVKNDGGNIDIVAGTNVTITADDANKYLYHFSLESDEPANVYSGNVTLDDSGEATVRLPGWFGALNNDFRYQLTCIGGFAQVYIADEISDNQFRIAGGTPGMKVSWQVTGIRHDAFAKAHRVHVETEKTGKERGKYLHPVEHGVSETMGIDYEIVQRVQAEQKKTEEEDKKIESEGK